MTNDFIDFFVQCGIGCRFKVADDILDSLTLANRIDSRENLTIEVNPIDETGKPVFNFLAVTIHDAAINYVPGLLLKRQHSCQLVVKTDAADQETQAKRLNELIEILTKQGHKVDPADKLVFPCEFNQCAGSPDFWDKIPAPTAWIDLINKDKIDPNAIINPEKRFLCRGGSCMVIAPSGIGKSVLVSQMAATWALGKPFLGIPVKQKLRSLILQSENDDGDLSEMARGVANGLGMTEAEKKEVNARVHIYSRIDIQAGRFVDMLHALILRHSPDLIFLDPLFAFIEGDANSQEIGTTFFRRSLDPIIRQSRSVLFTIHHTPKPKTKGKSSKLDYSYAGFGTSELTNWHRAIVTLVPEPKNDKLFQFLVSKRGSRAWPNTSQDFVYIKHADGDHLYWEVTVPPPKAVRQPKETSKKTVTKKETLLNEEVLNDPDLIAGGLEKKALLKLISAKHNVESRQARNLFNKSIALFNIKDGVYSLKPVGADVMLPASQPGKVEQDAEKQKPSTTETQDHISIKMDA